MNEYIYKFTDTDKNINDLIDSKAYKCLEYAMNGYNIEFKKLYNDLCKSSFNADNLQKGIYKLQGYIFDFRKFLKVYLVNFKYEGVYHKIYAINKTNLYNNFYINKNNINDIIEVPEC